MGRRQNEIYISPLTLQEAKICTRCGEEHDLTDFYLVFRTKFQKQYYSPWCKPCVKAYRKSREDSRVYVNARTGSHEIRCPQCQEAKPTYEFYRENYAYSKLCKVCVRTSKIAAE